MRRLILLIALCLPALGGAQVLDIEVTGIAQPTPVAVVPFGWEGQSSAAPMNVTTIWHVVTRVRAQLFCMVSVRPTTHNAAAPVVRSVAMRFRESIGSG